MKSYRKVYLGTSQKVNWLLFIELLIGTVIYASSGDCIRQLRKGVTLGFLYAFEFVCFPLPVILIFFILYHFNHQSHVFRWWPVSILGPGRSYLQRTPQQDTPCAPRDTAGLHQQASMTFQLLLIFHLQGFLQRSLEKISFLMASVGSLQMGRVGDGDQKAVTIDGLWSGHISRMSISLAEHENQSLYFLS